MSWYLASVLNPKKSNWNLWQAPASFEANSLRAKRISHSHLGAFRRGWRKANALMDGQIKAQARWHDHAEIRDASTIACLRQDPRCQHNDLISRETTQPPRLPDFNQTN